MGAALATRLLTASSPATRVRRETDATGSTNRAWIQADRLRAIGEMKLGREKTNASANVSAKTEVCLYDMHRIEIGLRSRLLSLDRLCDIFPPEILTLCSFQNYTGLCLYAETLEYKIKGSDMSWD